MLMQAATYPEHPNKWPSVLISPTKMLNLNNAGDKLQIHCKPNVEA
jgi:hypothetical protein